MTKQTRQMQEWAGQFGREYLDRNASTLQETEVLYEKNYGITRTGMNSDFLGGLDKNIRILEVGSNIGTQLLYLQRDGFENLSGIEISAYAVERARSNAKGIDIIHGSAFDIPYADSSFDLVFTSGVLIHVAPGDIAEVLDEMYRCTREYIWCFEYYAETYSPVSYREHENLLWKTDFARLFLERFDNLSLIKEKRFKYLDSNNADTMFLLKKK